MASSHQTGDDSDSDELAQRLRILLEEWHRVEDLPPTHTGPLSLFFPLQVAYLLPFSMHSRCQCDQYMPGKHLVCQTCRQWPSSDTWWRYFEIESLKEDSSRIQAQIDRRMRARRKDKAKGAASIGLDVDDDDKQADTADGSSE